MPDRFKFRFWNKTDKKMQEWNGCHLWQALNDECLIPMQCTGLKDKNGKLIYEGDIVKIKNGIFFIKYENGSFSIIRNQQPIDVWYEMLTEAWNDDVYPLSQLYFYDECINAEHIIDCIEVIGNIYENKELLTGVEN